MTWKSWPDYHCFKQWFLVTKLGEYFQFFPDEGKTNGCRYSFGYPSCPDLADQEKLFELLKPSKIGLSLTKSYQMVPELSVSGFIIFNKEAKFFVP